MRLDMAASTPPEDDVTAVDVHTLYREHGRFVASFLRHLGVRDDDLEDLIQEVFAHAHRKGGYKPGPASASTWLASIATRLVVGIRRTRARRGPTSHEVEALEEPTPQNPAQRLETRRSLERVNAALADLSLEHRAAFVLFEIEGETCESLAAMWNVPIGTVYSRLHHARRRFLAAYARLEGEPES